MPGYSPPSNEHTPLSRGLGLYLVLPSFMTAPHSNINPLLVANGFPHIPRGNLNYGLGMYFRFGRIEPGFDFAIGYQSVENLQQGSALLKKPTTVNLFVNYHVFRSNSFTVSPFVGFSATSTNLILSKQSSVDDFVSLLANPGTSLNLTHLSDGALAGVAFSLANHAAEHTGTFRLKFAYRFPLNPGYAWESGFANFSTTPLDSFPYFFIQLEMGVLSNWKKGMPWMERE
jgi:hypothetical protein